MGWFGWVGGAVVVVVKYQKLSCKHRSGAAASNRPTQKQGRGRNNTGVF